MLETPVVITSQIIGQALGEVPAVEQVHVLQQGGTCKVFTIVEHEDETAFDEIYAIERAIIRRYHEIQFDFNVIARDGLPTESTISLGEPVWRR